MESSLQRTGRSIQDIYAAHADRVYRVAWLYMKNRCDSEDVVQDVFVKLIGELRYTGASAADPHPHRAGRHRAHDPLRRQPGLPLYLSG